MTQAADWIQATATCRQCARDDMVSVPADRYAQWRAGGDVQQVFRNLSPQQREILIGSDMTRPFPYYLCKTCWDLTVPGEEEE